MTFRLFPFQPGIFIPFFMVWSIFPGTASCSLFQQKKYVFLMLRRIKLHRPELRVPRRLQEKLNGNTQHLILGVIQPALEDCRSHAVFPWSHHIFTLAALSLLFLPDENEVIWTLAYTVVKTSCNDHQGTICPPGWHLLEVVTWAHHGKL